MIHIILRKFGYIQVISKEQNEVQQLKEIKKRGINERNIFIDNCSGQYYNRTQYQQLKRLLRKGDVVYLHSLSQFGRNIIEIMKEWTDITKIIQADIVVLDIPNLDTAQYKDSFGISVEDLVLQILSWIEQVENNLIRKRRRTEINIGSQNGTSVGRPKVCITEEFVQAYDEWKSGKITAVKAMEQIGIKKTTFYKLVKEYENSFK
mgnify:CR=1 FL=1